VTRDELASIVGFPPSDEQWEAISAPLTGPMLVLAGAGSGKTAVMSARVLWAVGTGQVRPDQVLGLTFTNKAAGELSTRVRHLLDTLPTDDDAGDPVIATYHAFAMDLIAQYGLLVGAEPSAALLSPTDLAQATYRSVAQSRHACEELGTGVINTVRQRVQTLDEQLSEHLCSPGQLRAFDRTLIAALANERGKPAADALQAARRRLVASQVVQEVRKDRARQAVVSFADLMRLAVEVTARPEVVASLRERFAVVLVDEYQDTSVAQARMLRQVFGEGYPLTAVGDPLQAIYGWRGASVANIDGFAEDFDAPIRPLTINRRSGSLILDVANAVAAPVRAQHPAVEVLKPGGTRTGSVMAGLFTSFDNEVQWIVTAIREQLEAGRQPDQIAILCRTNKYIEMFAQSLRAAGIPVAAASLGSVLHLPEVVEVLSVLRVVQSGENAALVRLLTGPQWRIGDRDLAALGARAQSFIDADGAERSDLRQRAQDAVGQVDPVDVVSLLEAVYDPGPHVSDEARQRLTLFTRQLDAIRPALAAGVEEAAYRIIDATGLSVEVRLGPQAASRMDGLAALFDVIATYRSAHDDASVSAFLQWLDFAEQLDETPDADFPIRGHAVQVMSVHRAKGLEWECVFVPALSKGVFPSNQGRYLWTTHYEELPYPLRGDNSRLPHLPHWTARGGSFPDGFSKAATQLKEQYQQQDAFEENRLAYVALTRARQELFVSGHWFSREGQRREPSTYLLTAGQVAGVRFGPWVEAQPEPPPAVSAADLAWPADGEVFTDTSPPPDTADSLTLEESAWLARIDADIDAVYAREVELSRPTTEVRLPPVLSTSLLMRAAADPDRLARDLARPMPRLTSRAAQRGTAFHAWVAAGHQQLSLMPDWDLAADAALAPDDDLAALIAGYRRTAYADRMPYAVETEVAVTIEGIVVRGVIDAVYRNDDGSWEVVDWKTNRTHNADPMQLAIYRIAWAQRQGIGPEQVSAAFVYVADAQVVRPNLPSQAELAARLNAYRANLAVTAQ
jgi:DNA helicase-2/ATP-dependent DNA helicase PcrA